MEQALTDCELIEQAQGGDREAFGELVRRHRAKAFDWARNVTRDPYLAEDIVQEALLRAFLHLGTLADMGRFLPWLYRIVRNEALMKLRKSEHSGRERTFSAMEATRRDGYGVDWSDLDNILHYLSSRQVQPEDEAEPAAIFARKEFLTTIRHLLHGLTPKERAVFEAHFFRQLSPAEIARLFRTSTDNVYQSLARARHKVREERVRVRLRDYVAERRDTNAMEKAVLSLKKGPRSGEWKSCGTSFAGAVYAVLPYTGLSTPYTLTDVMGLSGQAFRLTVEEMHVDATGPSMYFWEPKFKDGLLNLGLTCEHTGDGGAPPTPFMLEKGITHIRKSVMRGMPVIAWDLFTPEFGIIYGYDDTEQLLYAEDGHAKKTIPYDRFGRGMSGGLFVLSVTGESPIGEWEAVSHALHMAIRHAYGEITFVGYVCGLSAYECWIDAFRKRRVDAIGNAYTTQVAADARRHAAEFLRGLARRLTQSGYRESAQRASEAAVQYEKTSAALTDFSALFPFPSGGAPNDPETATKAIELLDIAKASEEDGVEGLERLTRCIGDMTI